MFQNYFGYEEALPETIRETFMWLCQDVANLRTKWNFYLELFSDPESAALLTETAPAAFHLFQEALRRDLLMAICRLSDPDKSKAGDNPSLRTLGQKLGESQKTIPYLDEFLQACKPVRALRSRRLEHSDLAAGIDPQADPFPGIGRAQVEQILRLAERALNSFYQQYENGELIFTIIHDGGAEALLAWLRKGRKDTDNEEESMIKKPRGRLFREECTGQIVWNIAQDIKSDYTVYAIVGRHFP